MLAASPSTFWIFKSRQQENWPNRMWDGQLPSLRRALAGRLCCTRFVHTRIDTT